MERVDNLLQSIAKLYSDILQDNLVGIYIHGSIAFHCFNWDMSDIDFIVVVNKTLSEEVKLQLLGVLEQLRSQAPPKGFEMSIVLKKYCIDFLYPTPYELHFSNGWLAQYLNNPLSLCDNALKMDWDLAAHFTVIKHTGYVLCGNSINEVFHEVARDYYLDSIKRDVANAKTEISKSPTYTILNLCRVLAYQKHDLILSKEQGGRWGLENLPQKYTGIVFSALQNYLMQMPTMIEYNNGIDFCNYMLNIILS